MTDTTGPITGPNDAVQPLGEVRHTVRHEVIPFEDDFCKRWLLEARPDVVLLFPARDGYSDLILDRDQVRALHAHLGAWLETGSLKLPE